MELQKIINLLDNTPSQQSKFGSKNCVGIIEVAVGTYNSNSQINFKGSILKSSLSNYSDVYILVTGTITIPNTVTAANASNGTNMIIKSCVQFIDCISEVNNTHVHNAKDIDVVMIIYNSREYSENYLKTSGSL